MAAGMVPPLALGLATIIARRKFDKAQQEGGKAALVLGLCFITEGAIPFASADPLHVIVSSIVGSAVGGALVGLWHVGVPAPHGGFWVIALSSNWLGYLGAVAVGSIVAALMMGFWKKPIEK